MIGQTFDDYQRGDLLGWLAHLEALFDVADFRGRVSLEIAAEFWGERRAIQRLAMDERSDTTGAIECLCNLERRLRALAYPETSTGGAGPGGFCFRT